MARSVRPFTGTWQRIATAGKASFSGSGSLVWTVSTSTTAPTDDQGFSLHSTRTEHLELAAGEHLWVRGYGLLHLIADAVVAP